ncbi:MAG: DUF58 domain-containing protein [Bacteroidota bacterium]|nr:DUF58 domain-containing protein [Bacteroidota bacterium]
MPNIILHLSIIFPSMNVQSSLNRSSLPIRRFSFYLPFTWYFVVFALCCLGGYFWIRTFPKLPDTAYADIFPLLLHIAFLFLLIFLSLSFLSVVFSFLYFLIKKRRNQIQFLVETKATSNENLNGKQEVFVKMLPIIKPLLGFVKIRLQYDEQHVSKKFSLVEQRAGKLISTSIEGTYHWQLPAIKEYRIEKALIYFEDFFQFFSFALPVATNNRFYTVPNGTAGKTIKTFPRKTENTTTRIEEIKRVEGEYLNYKNFEGNDDVRRIVWKIYAKNKELVVRIPEVLDPYASHVYFYASFFSSFGKALGEVIEVPFLNYYKTYVWSIYRQLVNQGFEVRYLPDQSFASTGTGDIQQNVKHSISISHWQTDKNVKGYVNAKDAAMVVVSSLNDADEVAQLAEQWGNDISFVFVKLSDSLGNHQLGDWLQWLFVKNEQDTVTEYKRKWNFALLRSKILDNEKKLKAILQQFSKAEVVEA